MSEEKETLKKELKEARELIRSMGKQMERLRAEAALKHNPQYEIVDMEKSKIVPIIDIQQVDGYVRISIKSV